MSAPDGKASSLLERWRVLYEGGATLEQIAADEKTTLGKVHRGLRKAGVVMRRKGRRPGMDSGTKAWIDAAAEMFRRGATLQEISAHFGKSDLTVRVAFARKRVCR